MKKQNIEDIFSSIENFSSVPPPELWGKIEEELDKPKKKKRGILWWSAAASLLLGLSISSVLYFNTTSEKSIVTDALNNKTVSVDKNGTPQNSSKNKSEESYKIIKTQKTTVDSSLKNKSEQSNNSNTNPNKTVVAETDIVNNLDSRSSYKKSKTKVNNRNESLAEQPSTREEKRSNSFYNNTNTGFGNNKNSKLKNSIADAENISTKNSTQAKESILNDNLDTKNNPSIALNTAFENKTSKKGSVTKDDFDSKNNKNIALNTDAGNKKDDKISVKNAENLDDQKAISFKERSANNTNLLLSKIDSLQLAELHNLEESLKNPKKEKEIEEKTSLVSNAEKWSVEVFAGIANSENYKNDKTLGNVNSPKQSNAYGVKTNYKLNKKWAVSSGLKINELGQSLANVSYIDTKSIAYMSPENLYADRSTASNRISSNTDLVFVASANKENANNPVNNGIVNTASFESGDVDQRLKYLEMPFEVSYLILNKNKTSVSLNTGGFVGKLISNDVYLNGTAIGNNQNANDFVYGSLLSSTLQYRLYKKTNVFVEPGMNYYVNPLNNQSFNQFQWSFNFGLNVSF